jgi:hypothetical protein
VIGRRRPPVAVAAGERVLAWCHDSDGGVVAGTRDALYLPLPPSGSPEPVETLRVPWEQVEAADWAAESGVLRVSEVGSWGAPRPVHLLTLVEPTLLLQLVRERVTATVVLQRHVPISGRGGLRVIARRAPSGDRAVSWLYEYDEGVDPADPAVRAAAEAALAQAQDEVGVAGP